jgi:hypothetical protein
MPAHSSLISYLTYRYPKSCNVNRCKNIKSAILSPVPAVTQGVNVASTRKFGIRTHAHTDTRFI